MSPTAKPPRILAALLERILPRDWREAGTGDFEEQYAARFEDGGRRAAVAWYAFQIVRSIPHFILDMIHWRTIMLKNYFLITFRDMRRNTISSVINIIGLAMGIACCFLLMLLVRYELSFDRFHENGDRIFRVIRLDAPHGKEFRSTLIPETLGPRLAAEIPEVVDILRIYKTAEFVVEYEGKRLNTDPYFADDNLFKFFSFRLAQGNPETVFLEPDTAVVSQSFSKKLFGGDNPVGKTVLLYSLAGRYDIKITGVMRDIPPNSHVRFDIVAPLRHFKTRLEGKSDMAFTTYVRLRDGIESRRVEGKIPDLLKRFYREDFSKTNTFLLQKLADIHMRSDLDFEYGFNRNKVDPEIFKPLALIAFLVLLIASINFVNLSTARASRRALEVGLRKVIGAGRAQLVRQFLTETVILAFFSLVIGLLLAALILPVFNSLMKKELAMDFAAHVPLIGSLLVMTLAVGILSGLYPAIFLASFRPVESLKGSGKTGGKAGGLFRKGLVVVQFGTSIVFIMATLTIARQIAYIKNKDMGFDHGHVLVFQIGKDYSLRDRSALLQEEFMKHPAVVRVSVTCNFPGLSVGSPTPVSLSDRTDKPIEMFEVMVGADTLEFFGINFVRGTGYGSLSPEQRQGKIVINESAARMLGLDNPIGTRIRTDMIQGSAGSQEPLEICGVVRDFHTGSLRKKIRPSIFYFNETPFYALVRIRPENVQETLAGLKKIWSRLPTHLLFEPGFLDDYMISVSYREDIKSKKIFLFASCLSIGLAGMGIFGTTAFMVSRRRREIGIRKVLGATDRGIHRMLLVDFFRPVLAAGLVAWPVGILICRGWLRGFAYQTGIGWWNIPVSTGIVLAAALLTIAAQSFRASRANPADTIRYE